MASTLRKLYIQVLFKAHNRISRILAKLDDRSSKKTVIYEDLSPIDDAQKSKSYIDALHWALQNDNVKNIALTGPYGSGKTSILNTFKKNHPEYSYLNISLASFQDENLNGTEPVASRIDYEERHRLIELSILQQMFYKVSGDKVPDSRFNRIKSLGKKRLWGYILIVYITLLGLLILLNPKFWESFSWWNRLSDPYCDWLKYIGFLLILPAIYFISRYTIRLFNFSKFNKINLTKGELEFDPKSETSVLNKHLDEILYYFEVNPFNVVFLEDLDRFNDPEIFTKLRELNILINQSKQVNRRIVFLYVLKDDMFKDKSRTKFFDFIIPIIPVINASNSFDILVRKIKDSGLELKLNDNFLSNITLFIDDMRALKNIFNEFLLYRETLNDISLNDEELFAIIVYKNIYPDDFAALHNRKGTLYSVFESSKTVKNTIIKQKSEEIAAIQNTISVLEQNAHLSLQELRSIYLVEMISEENAALGVVVNGEMKPLSKIRESEDDFKWLTEQSNIQYYQYNSGYNQNRAANTGRSFADVEKKISTIHTFKSRESSIVENTLNGSKRLKADIERINTEINNIKKYKVAELLKVKPDPISQFDDTFLKSQLLVYLIRSGYINEQYNVLISYFYPDNLTANDMTFALSVAKREGRDFDFELTNIKMLISRLDNDDFLEPAILNYILVDYLIQNGKDYKEHLNNLFKQLSNESITSHLFIDAYFTNGKQKPKFFKTLFKVWNRFWEDIVEESGFPREKQILYLKFIAKHAEVEDLKKLNVNASLDKFISGMEDFIPVFQEADDLPLAKKLLDYLNIEFERLESVEMSPDLFGYVYHKWAYKLNKEMINLILVKMSEKPLTTPTLNKANYTLVRASELEELNAYIDDYIEEYVENLILGQPENSEESEETLQYLLNLDDDKLSIEHKKNLIIQQSVKLSKIDTVHDKELWMHLLAHNRVMIEWSNVLTYYEFKGSLDETLVNYLSSPEIFDELKLHRFNKGAEKESSVYEKFSLEILLNNDFDEVSYDALLNSNPYYYSDSIDIKNLSKSKVAKLIDRRLIRLSVEQFEILEEHFDDLLGSYIAQNISEYLKDKTNYTLSDKDYVNLLQSKISLQDKAILLSDISDSRLEKNPVLASYAGKAILEQTTYTITIERLSIIIKKGVHKSDNVKLFARYLNQLDINLIDNLLPFLGDPYKRLCDRGKQAIIPINKFNLEFVKALQSKGYFKKLLLEINNIRVYNRRKL